MTEKYARMMKTTFPDEYPAIEKSLPPLDPAAARQIEDIVACHVQWKTALDQKYPHLGDRSRPVRTQEDRAGLPSVETYTRAELQTCSPRTISLYHAATMKRIERGENEAEENLLNQVRKTRNSISVPTNNRNCPLPVDARTLALNIMPRHSRCFPAPYGVY